MTTALVVATAETDAGTPACLLPFRVGTVLSHLLDQLNRSGADRMHVLTRPEWELQVAAVVQRATVHGPVDLHRLFQLVASIAKEARGAILVAHGEVVTHDSVIMALVHDPQDSSGIISAGKGRYARHSTGIRLERGRVVAAESPYHAIERPTAVFLGLLKVGPDERKRFLTTACELSSLCASGLPEEWRVELAAKAERWGKQFFSRWSAQHALAEQLERGNIKDCWLPDPEELRTVIDDSFRSDVLQRVETARNDAVSLLLTGLVRTGAVLKNTSLDSLPWSRPLNQAQAETADVAIAGIDEEAVRLRSAVKASDGFFTTHFVSPYSKYIARWAAHRGLTPNQITVVSMLLGIAAAAGFAVGTRMGLVAGAILLQVAFVADCVDGQLARYTRQFSTLGAWLDAVFDRAKEYVVYAGLALGALRAGGEESVWVLAGAALSLQAFRHTVTFSFAEYRCQKMQEASRAPLKKSGRAEYETKRGRTVRSGADKEHDPHPDAVVLDEEGEPGAADTELLLEDRDAPSSPESRARRRARIRSAPAPAPKGGRSMPLRALGQAGVRASASFGRRRWTRWAKKILVLPIGERFALISLAAALTDARTTFVVLLTWGIAAALYAGTGLILRSWT